MENEMVSGKFLSNYKNDLDRVSEKLTLWSYAVIRSYIARSLVAAGFYPTFGIHHDNQLNAFNLSDDLIILDDSDGKLE